MTPKKQTIKQRYKTWSTNPKYMRGVSPSLREETLMEYAYYHGYMASARLRRAT